MPHTTTIAGSHAAQQARAREHAARLEAQVHARRDLDSTLHQHRLKTAPHFADELGDERSLWVNCRIDRCQADRELIYAVLSACGWSVDTERLSRERERYEVRRMHHKASGARMALIIKTPWSEVPTLECA